MIYKIYLLFFLLCNSIVTDNILKVNILAYIPTIVEFSKRYFNAKLFSSLSISKTSKKYIFPLKKFF